jgi:RNA polymerase sigma-70 factor (ECF subfamily)
VNVLAKSDEELIREIKAGNKELFDDLVLRYRESAIRFAIRYTRDYHKSEDLAQEAFARFYVNLEKYSPRGSFSSYLFKIIRNLCIDYHRVDDKYDEQKLTEGLSTNDDLPEEVVLARERDGLIDKMLLKLKENYRTALYLQHYEGMSYKEIAATLGLTDGQVRMSIYRGKKKLKKVIKEEMDI